MRFSFGCSSTCGCELWAVATLTERMPQRHCSSFSSYSGNHSEQNNICLFVLNVLQLLLSTTYIVKTRRYSVAKYFEVTKKQRSNRNLPAGASSSSFKPTRVYQTFKTHVLSRNELNKKFNGKKVPV